MILIILISGSLISGVILTSLCGQAARQAGGAVGGGGSVTKGKVSAQELARLYEQARAKMKAGEVNERS